MFHLDRTEPTDIRNRAVVLSGRGVPAGSKVRAADWAHVWKTFSTPGAPPNRYPASCHSDAYVGWRRFLSCPDVRRGAGELGARPDCCPQFASCCGLGTADPR